MVSTDVMKSTKNPNLTACALFNDWGFKNTIHEHIYTWKLS